MNEDCLKFRVWDKDAHEYNSRNAVALNKSGELVAQSVIGFIHYPDAYSVERCTGLKDKAGKLIYQGDIVHFDGVYVGQFFVVQWQEDMARFAFYEINGEFPYMVTCNDIPNGVEVVGNIHEPKWGIESEVKE